jgi:hypothetical protein
MVKNAWHRLRNQLARNTFKLTTLHALIDKRVKPDPLIGAVESTAAR